MNKPNKKYIIAANRGGLCNRIQCIISVMRLSKILDREPLVFWENNFQCGCEFSDLFENEIKMINFCDYSKISGRKESKVFERIIPNGEEIYKYIILQDNALVLFEKELSQDYNKKSQESRQWRNFKFCDNPKKIREGILKVLKSLKITRDISQKVSELEKRYDFNKTIGVHIRRGDFVFIPNGISKISTDERFFLRMKDILRIKPKTKFFLCTDSKKTESKFIKKFGDRIICLKKRKRDRREKLSIKEALMELLLLSKNPHILGTYGSSFSEIAWWFGDCKSKLELIGKNSKEMEMFMSYNNKNKVFKRINKIYLSLKRMLFYKEQPIILRISLL